jgi:hypothetical protein
MKTASRIFQVFIISFTLGLYLFLSGTVNDYTQNITNNQYSYKLIKK